MMQRMLPKRFDQSTKISRRAILSLNNSVMHYSVSSLEEKMYLRGTNRKRKLLSLSDAFSLQENMSIKCYKYARVRRRNSYYVGW